MSSHFLGIHFLRCKETVTWTSQGRWAGWDGGGPSLRRVLLGDLPLCAPGSSLLASHVEFGPFWLRARHVLLRTRRCHTRVCPPPGSPGSVSRGTGGLGSQGPGREAGGRWGGGAEKLDKGREIRDLDPEMGGALWGLRRVLHDYRHREWARQVLPHLFWFIWQGQVVQILIGQGGVPVTSCVQGQVLVFSRRHSVCRDGWRGQDAWPPALWLTGCSYKHSRRRLSSIRYFVDSAGSMNSGSHK